MATQALGSRTAAQDRRTQDGRRALTVLRAAGRVLGRVFGVVRPVAQTAGGPALAKGGPQPMTSGHSVWKNCPSGLSTRS